MDLRDVPLSGQGIGWMVVLRVVVTLRSVTSGIPQGLGLVPFNLNGALLGASLFSSANWVTLQHLQMQQGTLPRILPG